MKKTLYTLMALSLVFSTGCYFKYFNKVSKYYQPDERQILERTTTALGCGYGYDIDVELDYVFFATPDKTLTPEKQKAFEESIKDLPPETMKSFHEKIYRLKAITLFKMNEFKEDEKWKKFTLVQTYLLPGTEFYQQQIQEAAFKRDPSLAAAWETRKQEIDNSVKEELD